MNSHLLFQPPGTGKSHIVKALATETEATFISVSSADLVSRYLGESEKLIRALFELAKVSEWLSLQVVLFLVCRPALQERRPSVVFIDEVDAICSTRKDSEHEEVRRLKSEFLVRVRKRV